MYPEFTTVHKVLTEAGFKCYLVGGAVRDHLLEKTPKDFDFCTDALPQQTLDAFDAAGFLTYDLGIVHGTVAALLPSGNICEITTFRKDGTYSDSRRPDTVEFTTEIEEDLSRRDFTINAMAMKVDGEIIDPFRGEMDLNSGIVRCVGLANRRFAEDGLRVIRAARFAANLDFHIEYNTYNAMKANENYKHVSTERFCMELMKAMRGGDPSKFVQILYGCGVWNHYFPEFAKMEQMVQPKSHHVLDVLGHVLAALEEATGLTSDPIVRFAALMHDYGKPATFNGNESDPHFYGHEHVGAKLLKERLETLKGFSADQIERICNMVEHHMIMYEPMWTNPQLKRWLRKVGIENAKDIIITRKADTFAHKMKRNERYNSYDEMWSRIISLQTEPFSLKHLNINGNDLIALGYTPGSEIGSMLRALLNHVIEHPEDNTKEKLMQLAS